ncbi:hypothetical protein [Vibrio phage RYC]|nr:hypothetical protein [Vibrio phage RYC]
MHGSQKFLTITEKSLLAVPYLGVPLEDYEEFFEEDVWDYLNTQEKDMVEKFYSGAEFYHKELGWLVCVGRNPINEEDIVTVCKKSEQLVEVYYKNLIPKEEYENYLKSEAIGEMMNTLGSVEGMTLTAICTKLYEAGYHVSD